MARVSGKVALVTGAGTGIGQCTARLLAEEGARVVATDIDEASALATAALIGHGAIGMAHDVRKETDWIHVLDRTVAKMGPLDILINNAGILALGPRQDIESTSLEHWQAIQAVNADGVFLGCKLSVERMRERGGAIVNLSSIAGILGTPHLVAYGASKAAVRQFTKSVATFCARKQYNIRCNSVHPGPIQTNMGDALFGLGGGDVASVRESRSRDIPMGEIGQPQDVANCVLFLASDEARYVTGAELVVDGGYSVL
jgi:3(or 17)beta-hydroxysteroid dehydrogenase